MPMCFWVKLFEIAEEVTNPVLHNQICNKYDVEKELCSDGRPESECHDGCPGYAGKKSDYSEYLECKGDCGDYLADLPKSEGGPDA